MNENLPIVERFLSYLIDERAFSPYTSRCYGLDLRQFVEFLEGDLKMKVDMKAEQAALDASIAKKAAPASITASILSCDVERIRGFLAKLAEQSYSPATMARKIATLRSFHKWLEKRGFTASNPMTLIRTPKQARRLPKAITVDEVERLLSAPDDTDLLGARSRAHRLRTTQSGGTHERLSQSGGSALALRARRRRGRSPSNCRRRASVARDTLRSAFGRTIG